MTEIQQVDPYNDDAFRAWYDCFALGVRADRTAVVMTTYQAFCSSLRNAGTNRARHAVAALEDDRVVGSMLFELPLKEDLKVAEVEIDVPPEHRRRGIGTALWAWAADRAAREGRTVFQTEINVPGGHSLESWPGGQFALHRAFSSENVEDHLVVAMPFDKKPAG